VKNGLYQVQNFNFIIHQIFSKASYLTMNEKKNTHKKVDSCKLATCFQTGFLHGLFFGPEDGGNTFLRNIR
jgi:hypothetical protein